MVYESRLESETYQILAINNPTLPAKKHVKSLKEALTKGFGIKLSKVDEAELIESEQHKHKHECEQHIKNIEDKKSALEDKGIKLPQIGILEWPGLSRKA